MSKDKKQKLRDRVHEAINNMLTDDTPRHDNNLYHGCIINLGNKRVNINGATPDEIKEMLNRFFLKFEEQLSGDIIDKIERVANHSVQEAANLMIQTVVSKFDSLASECNNNFAKIHERMNSFVFDFKELDAKFDAKFDAANKNIIDATDACVTKDGEKTREFVTKDGEKTRELVTKNAETNSGKLDDVLTILKRIELWQWLSLPSGMSDHAKTQQYILGQIPKPIKKDTLISCLQHLGICAIYNGDTFEIIKGEKLYDILQKRLDAGDEKAKGACNNYIISDLIVLMGNSAIDQSTNQEEIVKLKEELKTAEAKRAEAEAELNKLRKELEESAKKSTESSSWGDYDPNDWGLSQDMGKVTITKYRGQAESLTIPATISGLSVVRIDGKAFSGCNSLKTITIPESICNISSRAFCDCIALWQINYNATKADDLSSEGIFANCGEIGSMEVIFEDSVEHIPANLCNGCHNLAKATISSNVKTIGKDSFKGCESITIYCESESRPSDWPDDWNSGSPVVWDCFNNNVAEDGYVYIFDRKIRYAIKDDCAMVARQSIGLSNDIKIPEKIWYNNEACTVNRIAENAFNNCKSLTSITIPDSVESIGANAFQGCSALTSITIGGGVTNIDKNAFDGCTSLKAVYITNIASWCGISFESVVSNPLHYAKRLYLNNRIVEEITIPDHVNEIGAYAFSDCELLNKIALPKSLNDIGDCAFRRCVSLNEITIPTGVSTMGNMVFSGCSGLKAIHCQLTSRPQGWADNWNPDERLVIWGHNDTTTQKAESKKCADTASTNSGKGYVVDFCYDTDEGGICITYYKGNAGYVAIPSKIDGKLVTRIAWYAFSGCSGLTSITIPDSVTRIGSKAFYGCSGLTSITIPDSVTSIGDSTFEGCSGLTSITIPDSVTSIGYYAFEGCISLTSITIPDSVTRIGSKAFYGCSGLTSITIPDSVTSIGDSTFEGCSGLTSVTIPDSVTSIDYRAFYGCSGLTSITIPDGVTSIGDSAFYRCSGLTSITIPDSVMSIDKYAFGRCGALSIYCKAASKPQGWSDGWNSSKRPVSWKKNDATIKKEESKKCVITEVADSNKKRVTAKVADSNDFDYGRRIGGIRIKKYRGQEKDIIIPSIIKRKRVTSIGDHAFEGCRGLTSVTIPDSVTSIGMSAFSGCSGLTSVTIPDSVTSIGMSAFSGCSGLTSITIPDSVTSIGMSAFYYCCGLTSIMVEEGNSVYHSAGNCIIETASKTLIAGCKTSVIPTDGSVTSIGYGAFSGCIFGKIDHKMAIFGRVGWKRIDIPDSVTSIGNMAFWGCDGLRSITIPDSVTSIGNDAFWRCDGLRSITIPDSVTSIGDGAFWGCHELALIIFQGTMQQWKDISKGDSWNSHTGNYTVTCTDGVLDKNGRRIS